MEVLLRRPICIAAGVALGCSSAVFAAEPAPSNPDTLQAIQQLQLNDTQEAATLQAMQTTLADIQNTLQGLIPSAVGNVLNTATLSIGENPSNSVPGTATLRMSRPDQRR